MKKKKGMTRRAFIKKSSITAIGAAGSTLFLTSPQAAWSETGQTPVALIRNREVLDESGNAKYEVILEMLDTAVTALLEESDPVKAWKKIVKPHDRVGIKSNEWSYLPTPARLEEAINRRLLDAGVGEKNIKIQDRGIYKDDFFLKATALINTRPMRTHHWSGVGSLIKNYITFVQKPYEYHGDSCADLATLWKLPAVKGKTRLNVLVMLTPLFHGVGPHHFNPRYLWKYYGILVGFDPVAVDAVGVRILQNKRKAFFAEERPLLPPPKHIFLADTRHHLGTAAMDQIKLIKIGDTGDILID
jgi:hypothetical protein